MIDIIFHPDDADVVWHTLWMRLVQTVGLFSLVRILACLSLASVFFLFQRCIHVSINSIAPHSFKQCSSHSVCDGMCGRFHFLYECFFIYSMLREMIKLYAIIECNSTKNSLVAKMSHARSLKGVCHWVSIRFYIFFFLNEYQWLMRYDAWKWWQKACRYDLYHLSCVWTPTTHSLAKIDQHVEWCKQRQQMRAAIWTQIVLYQSHERAKVRLMLLSHCISF